jgi:ATP-dependent Clp protease ATP-binding subunit ClpA
MDTGVFSDYGQRPSPVVPPAESFQPGLLAELVQLGERLTLDLNHTEVDVAHLLWALGQCGDPVTRADMEQHGLGPEAVQAALVEMTPQMGPDAVVVGSPALSADARLALNDALSEAERLDQTPAGSAHLLFALLNSAGLLMLLRSIHSDPRPIREALRARLQGKGKPCER